MNAVNEKILILKPASSATGGISNYYEVLNGQFNLPVEFFLRGARTWPQKDSKFNEALRFFSDYYRFFKKINNDEICLVQTSTSLAPLSVIRDGIFLWLAKKKKLKTIVFFRGWDHNFEKKLERKYLRLFKKIFFTADCFIVLSKEFKQTLSKWGYLKPIYIESTIVDSKLLKGVDRNLTQIREERYQSEGIKGLLFLARIEKEKGIYETIDAFSKVKLHHPELSLAIAGSGRELRNIKEYIIEKNISGVEFLGFVKEEEKKKVFLDADIYLLPSYTEGMPNSALEAMAFGLPIIGTPVGGLNDLLEDSVTGFRVIVKDSDSLSSKIVELIENPEMAAKISKYNFELAHSTYTTDKVVERMEKIFKETLFSNG